MLRLLGCGVEGGARLAVGTLGVTRAAEGRRAAFLPHGVGGFAAVFVFFGDGACASLMRRDNDGIDTIPPLLGRALPPAGFLNSDLSGAADLARADTGREGAVGFFCLGGRERDGREKTEEKAGIGFVFRFDRRRPRGGHLEWARLVRQLPFQSTHCPAANLNLANLSRPCHQGKLEPGWDPAWCPCGRRLSSSSSSSSTSSSRLPRQRRRRRFASSSLASS